MVFCVKVKEMSAKTFLGNVMVLPEEAGVNGKIILRGKILIIVCLTEVAGESGTNCAPQKFLLSQKFRHLTG